jgi:hypothetical protein
VVVHVCYCLCSRRSVVYVASVCVCVVYTVRPILIFDVVLKGLKQDTPLFNSRRGGLVVSKGKRT